MTKGRHIKARNKSMRVAHIGEVALPKTDAQNIWTSEFGWVLKMGKKTIHAKAYEERLKRTKG